MQEDNIYSPPKSDLVSTGSDPASVSEDILAGRWARFGAWLIDGVVSGVLAYLVANYTGHWDKAIEGAISVYDSLLLTLFGLLIFLILNGYLLAKRGQTIGKWALGIKVISVKNLNLLPLWKIFFVRHLPQTVVAMIPMVGGFLLVIEWFFIFRDDRRCVHDLIAGTIVVKEYAH